MYKPHSMRRRGNHARFLPKATKASIRYNNTNRQRTRSVLPSDPFSAQSNFFHRLLLKQFPDFSRPIIHPLCRRLPLTSYRQPIRRYTNRGPNTSTARKCQTTFQSKFRPQRFGHNLRRFPRCQRRQMFRRASHVGLSYTNQEQYERLPRRYRPGNVPNQFPNN